MSLAIPGWKPKFKTLEESLMYMSESMERSRAETERALKESRAESERAMRASREEAEARMAASREEAEKRHAETERAMRVSREEADKRHAETERALKASREEADKRHAETERELRELKETVKSVTETVKGTSESVKGTSDDLKFWVVHFDNRIGYLVEQILVPGIRPIMADYGHNFTNLGPNRTYYRGRGNKLTEIDLMLENCEEVMAVEVKTRLRKDDVEYHLGRLKKLRDNEDITGLRGKVLYAGMAAVQVDDDARDFALGLGMYVIEMEEETKYIKVVRPAGGLGRW